MNAWLGLNKRQQGNKGEELAVEHLKANGYRILARNVRSKFGEIDCVAQQGRTLCFVEIKARSSTTFGWPEESVHPKKQWRLVRLARWYLQSKRLDDCPVRFDVVSILCNPDGSLARARIIPNAFEAA